MTHKGGVSTCVRSNGTAEGTGRRRRGGEEGGAAGSGGERRVQGEQHARTLHTFLTAGGGIQIASGADENRDRPRLAGERRRKRREKAAVKEREREEGRTSVAS